jgi:branched-subunit amino acid aminotransferase/4-amino-4-deoxychorismate lyase
VSLLALAVSGRGVVPPHEPVIAADDEGFGRGRAAFETLRVYAGRPFRLEQHLERLARSAARIGLPPPDLDEVRDLGAQALEAAGAADAVLRFYWTPGAAGGRPTALALVSALPEWIEPARVRGQRLAALTMPRRTLGWLLPGTKSVSYATHIGAELEAKTRGADDALFVDEEGIVLEGPVTNIWWREGDVLVTPSLDLGILAGETRAALLELAPDEGLRVEEGAYPLERLTRADEAFTSSSVREVMPVVAIDGRPLPRGPAAGQLQAALRRLAGAVHDQVG